MSEIDLKYLDKSSDAANLVIDGVIALSWLLGTAETTLSGVVIHYARATYMQDQLFKRVMGARIAFSVVNILLVSWQLYNHKRSKRNDESIKTKVSLGTASFALCLCSTILLEVGVGAFHRYGSDLESLVYDELQAIQGLAWTMLTLHIIALLAGCLIIHNGRSRFGSDILPCYYEVIGEDENSVDVKDALAVTLPDDISDGSIEDERRFEDCSASI